MVNIFGIMVTGKTFGRRGIPMRIADIDFIKSPAEYLEKLDLEPIHITKNGQEYAVLSKSIKTPITDSLVGILKGVDIANSADIKKMRLGA